MELDTCDRATGQCFRWVKGGCHPEVDGTAGLPSAPEIPCVPRRLRLVPIPDLMLCGVIEPVYPKVGNSRPPVGVGADAAHLLSPAMVQPFGPAVEEALYDSLPMRGIDPGREPVPDETTVCRFRHLYRIVTESSSGHFGCAAPGADSGLTQASGFRQSAPLRPLLSAPRPAHLRTANA